MLGLAPAAVVAAAVVGFTLWAAHRWPNEKRAVVGTVHGAGVRGERLARRSRRAAASLVRDALARRKRQRAFERSVGVSLERLAQQPELLALALEALAAQDEPDGMLAYVRQAEAAVHRGDRRRELRARLRGIRRTLRHAERALRAEARYAEHFYRRAWHAPGPAWLSKSADGVWSRHDRPCVPPLVRRRSAQPTLGGLADAAALGALADVASERLDYEQRDALTAPFDALWVLFEEVER